MLKPSAVELRVKLWKLYFTEDKKYTIPKPGLNFLKNEIIKNKKFLLICGFENFDKLYVRVDILERLFLKYQLLHKMHQNFQNHRLKEIYYFFLIHPLKNSNQVLE